MSRLGGGGEDGIRNRKSSAYRALAPKRQRPRGWAGHRLAQGLGDFSLARAPCLATSASHLLRDVEGGH